MIRYPVTRSSVLHRSVGTDSLISLLKDLIVLNEQILPQEAVVNDGNTVNLTLNEGNMPVGLNTAATLLLQEYG